MSSLYDRQSKLKLNQNQSITVVGCGGIGYWVAKFSAMSGIDPIYLFDPDTFEEVQNVIDERAHNLSLEIINAFNQVVEDEQA